MIQVMLFFYARHRDIVPVAIHVSSPLWQLHPLNFLKVNGDNAWDMETRCLSLGLVVRDHLSHCVKA